MPKITVNKANIYYESHGNGQPLVLISGLMSDHSRWLPVLNALMKKYQVILLDNRGVGRTTDEGSDFSVETMAEDIMKLIHHLNLYKPHIVGHSLGGAVAQTIAKHYQNDIASISLCNTFIKFNFVGREVFSNLLKLYEKGASQRDMMMAIIPWLFSPHFIKPELFEFICKVSEENPYQQSLFDYKRQLKALYEFDSSAWIHTIHVPTLIIGSHHDMIATIEESYEIANKIANNHLVKLLTGHASQIERPMLFVKALDDFYRNIT